MNALYHWEKNLWIILPQFTHDTCVKNQVIYLGRLQHLNCICRQTRQSRRHCNFLQELLFNDAENRDYDALRRNDIGNGSKNSPWATVSKNGYFSWWQIAVLLSLTPFTVQRFFLMRLDIVQTMIEWKWLITCLEEHFSLCHLRHHCYIISWETEQEDHAVGGQRKLTYDNSDFPSE